MRFLYSSFVLLSLICATTSSAFAAITDVNRTFDVYGGYSPALGTCYGPDSIITVNDIDLGPTPVLNSIAISGISINNLQSIKSENFGSSGMTAGFLSLYNFARISFTSGTQTREMALQNMSVTGEAVMRLKPFDGVLDLLGTSSQHTNIAEDLSLPNFNIHDSTFLFQVVLTRTIQIRITGCAFTQVQGSGNIATQFLAHAAINLTIDTQGAG